MPGKERREERIDEAVTTSEFRMPRATFAFRMFSGFGKGWLGVVGVMVALSVICGALLDWRFFVVTLMLIMVVTPMVLILLYYNHGLRRECFFNIMPHTVTADRGNVTVRMKVSFPPDENADDSENPSPQEEASEPAAEWREWSYPPGSLGRYSVDGKSVCVPFLPPRKGFLWLPSDAFADAGEFRKFIENLGIIV